MQNAPALQLVIFDCDGVMFDSIEANRRYYNHILAAFGHSPMDENELQFVHIHHVVDSVRYIYRKFPEDYDKADRYRRKLSYTPYLQYMVMERDLVQFLQYLRPAYHTAISTNRSNTMPSLMEMFDLDQYFEKVVTAMDVEHPKPHPEALHTILNHFRLTADQAVYIGDSQIDRQHSAAVGMRLIAFKNRELDADYHVDSFMEITSLGIL